MIEAEELKTHSPSDTTSQNIYLVGFPSLSDFRHFARSHAIKAPDDATLTEQWEAAKTVVESLKQTEAGVADDPQFEQLGPADEPLLAQGFHHSLRCFPLFRQRCVVWSLYRVTAREMPE